MVGDFGLSNGQQTAQIVMWAMWSVPLFMSVDLRDIGVFAEELLLNKDIISINQDWAGSPSYRVWQDKRLPVSTSYFFMLQTSILFLCFPLHEQCLIKYPCYFKFG